MKKLIIIFALFSSLLSAQSSAQWENVYGSNGLESGYSVKTYFDIGYITAGSSGSGGVSDGYAVCVDTLGLVKWNQYYGGTNVDVFRSVHVLPDSGFVFAGYSNSAGYGGYDGWLVRTDKNGDTLWTKHYGTADWDFFYSVDVMHDSGFLLTGGTYGAGSGDEDVYVVRTNKNGDTLWTRTYGGARMDEAQYGIERGDSTLLVTGITSSFGDTLGDVLIMRLNSVNGDTMWTRKYGSVNAKDIGYGIADAYPASGFYVVGMTMGTGNGDCLFLILDVNNNILSNITFGGTAYDDFRSVVYKGSFMVGVAGSTESTGGGNGDMYFFRNETGWFFTTFGTTYHDEGMSIDTTNDSGYILCGATSGYNSFLPNIYLVKVDTSGLSSGVLAVREVDYSSDVSVNIFPVPANERCTFFLDGPGFDGNTIDIRVTNLVGEEMMNMANADVTHLAGHSVTGELDLSRLSPGMYLVSFNSGSRCIGTKRIVISR